MKRSYDYTVNGLKMTASYEDKTVQDIFMPLLKKWSNLYHQKDRRIIVFLSAPPGVGKTTVSQFLEYLSKKENAVEEIQAVGLDGFHYHQDYILTHDTKVDGITVPMREVKGCPETFDFKKLKNKIKELKKTDVLWPVYDRRIHDVLEDAVKITGQIVLIEGNWLLLKETPWDMLIDECDDSVFISADEEQLHTRLVKRKIKGGLTKEEAEAFYQRSDRKNIKRLMQSHWQASEILIMKDNGDYVRIQEDES